MGKEFLFHVIKNVLELNSHDGYTTVNIVKPHIKMVNFMVHELHLIFKNKSHFKKYQLIHMTSNLKSSFHLS